MSNRRCLLIINGGSSTVKFALFEIALLKPVLSGKISGLGKGHGVLEYSNAPGETTHKNVLAVNQNDCALLIIGLINDSRVAVTAVVHRIVLGLKHTQPQVITTELLSYLQTLTAFDPEHIPGELLLIESFMHHFPSQRHIACFDTAFHSTMPSVARQIAIPRRFKEKGIERYGFHGISYSFLLSELKTIATGIEADGRIILAHLGSGASLAAVKEGKSVDTSMGFTPAGGIPMSTRSGDLDPGVASYMIRVEKLTPTEFNTMINHGSGLLGISEVSSDVRDLLTLQATDHRAAEAIEFFCYQIKKCIGAYAAVLGGVETLVFSGGIGENIPEIRTRICSGLNFLGIVIDESRNTNNEDVISSKEGAVKIRVIKTNEELMMARLAGPILAKL